MSLLAAEYAAPAGMQPALRRPAAASILPGGRIAAPLGLQFPIDDNPRAIAVSPGGRFAVSA
ncbi:MAG: hypothetical protein ACRD96_03490, partial [Bryobacteraceae bacterium]